MLDFTKKYIQRQYEGNGGHADKFDQDEKILMSIHQLGVLLENYSKERKKHDNSN